MGMALRGVPRDSFYISSKVGTHPSRPGDYSADAARWTAWRAVAALEDGGDGAIEVPSAILQAAEAARFCCGECVQILGGHGYIQDHPAEKWMRDARAQENLYGIAGLEANALGDTLLG